MPSGVKLLIEYEGELITVTEIARKEGLDAHTLKNYYNQKGDIYRAIEETRKISTKGIHFEGVQLIENDINRDGFIKKRRSQKSQTIRIKGTEVNLYDMSLVIGIKYSKLLNLVGKGMTINEIKEKYANKPKRTVKLKDVRKLEDGQDLFDVCVKNRLNYSYIYIAIHEYGKAIHEADEMYRKNEKKIPVQWIYEKYGTILRHLMVNDNIDMAEIVEYLKNGNMSIQDALEKYIIRKNAKARNINEEELEELYGLIVESGLDKEEIQGFRTSLKLNVNEESSIMQSKNEIDIVMREMELFEIYEAIENGYYTEDEIPQVLQEFEVTPEEIDTVFGDLIFKYDYNFFQDQTKLQRMDIIKGIAKKWDYLSGMQRQETLKENDISVRERIQIESISRRIIRFKKMLNQQTQEAPMHE